MEKVLIIEPNPYHGEVLPGIVKYFSELKYVVDVFIRSECQEDSPFVRFGEEVQINYYNVNELGYFWTKEKLEKYDFVFFTSMEHLENNKCGRFIDELPITSVTRYGFLGMYHTNSLVSTFNDNIMLSAGRLFFISKFQTRDYPQAKELSPIYFGDFTGDVGHRKSGNIVILSIGGATDMGLIKKAFFALKKKDRKRIIFWNIGVSASKEKNFIYYIKKFVNKIRGLWNVVYRNDKNFIDIGRVKFSELFDRTLDADFIIISMDTSLENYKRYLRNSSSGSRQLILGFRKPCILPLEIADAYGFEKGEYVGYERGGLFDALYSAINMSQEQYDSMVKKLDDKYDRIFKESLGNLSQTIENLKQEKEIEVESIEKQRV